jgi:hypothetical protein
MLFWIDRWRKDYAIYCTHPLLYPIANDFTITVENIFTNGTLHLEFRRQLVGVFLNEWHTLSMS